MDGLRTYTYNDEGIRIAKNDRGTLHTYQVDGTQIVSETWGIHTIFYVYDENGSIAGMRYRTSNYAEGVFDEFLFEKNLQGDVVAIYNASGVKLVSYTYDACGKVTTTYSNGGASTGARYNPFRYRGYYYDEDTGFYYLNSRYYDPCIGRFINADVYLNANGDIVGHNMYVYCSNNPIMGYDPTGEWNWGGVLTGLGIIAATVITVATCGVGSGIGAVVAMAAFTTGATMTYSAATDSSMVIDLSFSYQVDPQTYGKAGVSLVIDFSEDGGIYGYGHIGAGAGTSSGISYSVGTVDNLTKAEDYSRHFIDVNAGSTFGFDHCFDPTEKYSEATKANSITFGNGYNYGVGYDYYSLPLVIVRWR